MTPIRQAPHPGRYAAKSAGAIVYYARVGNRIKIGWTANLERRMSQLQPEELLVIEPGGPLQEAARHQQFFALWTTGEWFRYEDPLAAHISMLRPCNV